ncbi:uncharacterized protein LOC118437690 [Folsomia candida]|nr:uncharacterized protein LOC118437690 [Folsomia candida]
MDKPPIMTRPAPSPVGGRGPRKTVAPRPSPPPPLEGPFIQQRAPLHEDIQTYKPGWSIPKLRVEDIGRSSSNRGLQILPPRKKSSANPVANTDMLGQFDKFVANPSPMITEKRSSQLRQKLRHETKEKLADSKMEKEMDKMRNKFFGEISSELGFGYEQTSPDTNSKRPVAPQLSAIRLAPAETDSWSVISSKMTKSLKDWATDAQKAENREWVQSSASGNLLNKKTHRGTRTIRPRSKSKTRAALPAGTLREYLDMGTGRSARRVVNSEDKLAIISRGFRKTLEPIASRDIRSLIQTPPENVMEKLSLEHDSALERSPRSSHQPAKNTEVKTGGDAVSSSHATRKKTRVNNNAQSHEIPRGRSGSQNLAGLMNFQSLLEIQSANEGLPSSKERVAKQTKPDSQKRKSLPEMKQKLLLSGTEMHGTLQRSVKSIDQAAKIAQNLGNLMSKVAMQNAAKSNNDASLDQQKSLKSTSTMSSPAESQKSIDPELKDLLHRNPYAPLTEEIRRRADRLADVVEQAERNLKLHGAAFGITSSPKIRSHGNSPRKNDQKTTSTSMTTTSSGTDFGLQTESPRIIKGTIEPPGAEFEFVSDMSYTDQLMLKKLRGLKSSWGES